ncbi:M3 family metallopeptidase [Elizabethkingia meningoseptica]|uniref:M3 family metallopeptidase n=1 Tax=Elizabethkingia meningoseptica TaxID=238 RepID=UPI0023AF18C2|nr:M3 family metallopeptidase [Elizabethkingia meningoseptica]MDE5468826.1 M3 family metallopeptidase [Elizabethkingia meningoseptica]MDE5476139.1 M3 family metallopeptidase [Elizabethkingia meningoseptica]MDE5479074.1 M3 family metallopeptidase [Elizabethkingia meningoseptica]MDE5485022.1 M3 family metallopeptidase [Elizabethkingia meningoseptica]MDE5502475.1 M3 family metallopeptidase [Elizabethkingia meningoseptica]
MSNILLEYFQTPFHTAPFDQIKNEYYLPAFQELIKKSETEIEQIANNPEAPTFSNTIEALAYSGEQLDVVSNIFFNLNSAETNDEIQQIAQEVSPLLTEYSSKISQNEQLFNRIKRVYDDKAGYSLNEEQETLLTETYKGFVRSGALLNEKDKEQLRKINVELSTKQLQFGQNVLAATNSYIKHITNKEDLAGIPEAILAQYAEEAKERGLDGWAVSLQYPSYVPFMTYAQNRALRQELALANGKKSFEGNEFDNQQLIKDIISLRDQKAKLLGYDNFASFVLEERMAKSPQKVEDFLHELLEKATPYGQKEIEELKILAKEDGIEDMQSYDHPYYAEKLRKQKYDLNDEELKPYFSLEKVQDAVFRLAGQLFGLSFEERKDIPKYHEEVRTYEVKENGNYKAVLYVDYFPRKGKRAGAWMTSYKNQYKQNGENSRPHISVVCNFNKPTGDTPSLLTFQEVTTLFHEFGHAIHGILANTQYPNLSGTSVKWDFVELPSQFLENFCYEPEFLKTFAQHYKTGEVLSDEKIQRIENSKSFMEGYQTLRQLGFGLLDMAYHIKPQEVKDIKAFEDEQTSATQLYPVNPETAISPSFSHVFQGGYASGYYSYKWAEVLDADAFAYFKETGIFNPETAAKYKVLLSSGGTKDPMELYKNFRGSEPKVESLLKRAFGS